MERDRQLALDDDERDVQPAPSARPARRRSPGMARTANAASRTLPVGLFADAVNAGIVGSDATEDAGAREAG